MLQLLALEPRFLLRLLEIRDRLDHLIIESLNDLLRHLDRRVFLLRVSFEQSQLVL